MKLFYIANSRIPTEKAHGLHIVKMCEALAAQCEEITLVLPQRKNAIKEDLFSYYNVKKNFNIQYLPVLDFVGKGFLGYWVAQLTFSLKLLLKNFEKKKAVILTRDEWSGWLLAMLGYKVFYDMHGFPVKWRWPWGRAMKKMLGVICTNNWKLTECQRLFGIKSEKLLLARNGFDPKDYIEELPKAAIKEQLHWPTDRLIAVYSGHLYDWKGVDMVAAAAQFLPEVSFILIGGNEREIEIFKKRNKLTDNVVVISQRPHQEIPVYLRAADILLLPNSARSKNPRFAGYSTFDTSPIKMFEYMASRRPIVASDLPAIREVLNENNAILVEADNPVALAEGIKCVTSDQELVKNLSEQAYQEVQSYTWQKRVEKIIEFIKKLS